VGIVTGYGLEIMTGVIVSGYSDWIRFGDYDRCKRGGIAQWV
jgi:hypothetical protein